MGQRMPRMQHTWWQHGVFWLLACSYVVVGSSPSSHTPLPGMTNGLQAQDLLHYEVAECRHWLPAAVLGNVLLQQRL